MGSVYFLDFLIYISILVSDYLYELNVVNRIGEFLFYYKRELELNFTNGFLTIVIFTILYIVIVLLKKYINKKYPRIKEHLANKIFYDWL